MIFSIYSCSSNKLGWVDVFFNKEHVASLFKKNALYKFLDCRNVDYSSILSKKLLPISDWFKQKQYKDVLDYIVSVGCSYYFEYIPLSKFGLPVPEK